MESVGTRLRNRRNQFDYSQNELEDMAEVSRGIVSAFERDVKYPRDIGIYARLSTVLEVPIHYLFPPDVIEILSQNKANGDFKELLELVQTKEQLEGLQLIVDGVGKFYPSS